MYPLAVDQPYPYNQWWIAAYASEVTRDILAREILGEPIIFYRTETGKAVALAGICPHRIYPLAKGRIVGDTVQCAYHGFQFGADGRCLKVPSQSSVPQNSTLRSYPLVERANLLWIWTGAAELADPNDIPDLDSVGLGREDWAVEQHPVCTVEARYTLMIENLLDLSHISFIHATSIPGGGAVAEIPAEVIETEKSLIVQRLGKNLPLNPILKLQFPQQTGPVNQHFDAEYFGPCLTRTGGTIYDSASGQKLGTQNYIHMYTPANPHRQHCFVNTARDFGIDRPELGDIHIKMGKHIGPEDIDAVESIERMLQSGATMPKEISARVDNGALLVRRRMQAQIRSEMLRGTHAKKPVSIEAV
ncbi:aromatic ring-hydroxylating dioxygenase subunit alpha [Sphingobium sp. MK2]|uniref:aromatic ring-hydroxylating dioxygenase subunit alpha n=1 Tax=Sphingobium sp. MK2 TaxID=3116540 RepID=UPI0032E35FFE